MLPQMIETRARRVLSDFCVLNVAFSARRRDGGGDKAISCVCIAIPATQKVVDRHVNMMRCI